MVVNNRINNYKEFLIGNKAYQEYMVLPMCNRACQKENKNPEALRFINMNGNSTKKKDCNLLSLISVTLLMGNKSTRVKINFIAIIENILQSLRNISQVPEIEINTTPRVKPFFILDEGSINAVPYNRIFNSIKYSQQTNDAKVDINFYHNKKNLIIEVTDNEIGIHKDIQQRIFNMFYVGNSVFKSSGLALCIVKSSVEKLKGNITLESEPFKSSLFGAVLLYLK